MVNLMTTNTTPMTNMMMVMTTSTSQGGATVASVLMKMHFLEPSAYWSIPGDQPNFWTWWTMLNNYFYWLDRHASPMDPLNDKDKYQLVCTLHYCLITQII